MYRGTVHEQQKTLDQTRMSAASRIAEAQGEALHKEVECYTRKFQQQKRKLFRAQENHREILKQYQNQVSDLQNLKTKKYQTELSKLNTKIKELQTNLEKGIASYNEALSRNNTLKNQIDELRKQKKNQSEAYKTLVQKIEELNSSIRNIDQSIVLKKSRVEKTKDQIIEIRDKNEKENGMHLSRVDELKKSACFSSTIRDTMKNNTSRGEPASDAQPIVKLRIKNLMHLNKQKIKIAELYKKNMEKIEQSFKQIRQQSGISDLQEITQTFLKQQNQNTFIYEYINKLTNQLESLKQQNQVLEEKIGKEQEQIKEQRNLMSGTPAQQRERNKIEAYYQQKQKPIERLSKFLSEIEPELVQVLGLQADSGNLLNYINVEQYLAAVQRLIDSKYKPEKQTSGSEIKQSFTKYSKAAPNITTEDLRDKGEEHMLEKGKLRDFASEFWDKKKQTK